MTRKKNNISAEKLMNSVNFHLTKLYFYGKIHKSKIKHDTGYQKWSKI